MKGVFLDLASLAEQDLDLSGFDRALDDWHTYPATAPADRLAHIADAEVVVTNKVVLDEAVLRAAPKLRLICLTATGYNNVAIDTARELGIVVSNVVGLRHRQRCTARLCADAGAPHPPVRLHRSGPAR